MTSLAGDPDKEIMDGDLDKEIMDRYGGMLQEAVEASSTPLEIGLWELPLRTYSATVCVSRSIVGALQRQQIYKLG
jgi:hypothetical protein